MELVERQEIFHLQRIARADAEMQEFFMDPLHFPIQWHGLDRRGRHGFNGQRTARSILDPLQEFGDAFSPVQKSTYIHSSSRDWNGYIFRYPSFESARRYCRDYDFLWQFVRCLFFSSHCNWNTLE